MSQPASAARRSAPSPAADARSAPRPRAPALPPEATLTERALRATYQVILPRLTKDFCSSRLGVARPSYDRLVTMDFDTAMQIATDLALRDEAGEPDWRGLMADAARHGSGLYRRVERAHLESAAAELVEHVRALPPPVRDVVELRSFGRSWRLISADLPDRAFFSLTDDYVLGLRLLWTRAGEVVGRMV